MNKPILHDGRTDAEKRYDLERTGELYIKPTDDAEPVMPANPSPLLLDMIAWAKVEIDTAREADRIIAEHRAAEFARGYRDGQAIGRALIAGDEEEEDDAGDDTELFGALADGTPMYGYMETMHDGPRQRYGCVIAYLAIDGWSITADDAGHLSGNNTGQKIEFDAATIEQIRTLRTLLLSDTCERLLAAAEAWGRGDTEPPAFAA